MTASIPCIKLALAQLFAGTPVVLSRVSKLSLQVLIHGCEP